MNINTRLEEVTNNLIKKVSEQEIYQKQLAELAPKIKSVLNGISPEVIQYLNSLGYNTDALMDFDEQRFMVDQRYAVKYRSIVRDLTEKNLERLENLQQR